MTEGQITFNDGAAYERIMGKWSRLAGDIFLDWLQPDGQLRWIDVGCGNGAFTDLLVARCAVKEVVGIDPSEAQLSFARERLAGRPAWFQLGSATALPFPDESFDAAVMALVIFFVPDPAKGVEEMQRVVAPGGRVSAYVWDVIGGGFPPEPIQTELRVFGLDPQRPPQFQVSRLDALHDLWSNAGLKNIETKSISVSRTFEDFEDYWSTSILGPSVASLVTEMSESDVDLLKSRLRARVAQASEGRIVVDAVANAIMGTVPW